MIEFLYACPVVWKQWLLPTETVQYDIVYWYHNGRVVPGKSQANIVSKNIGTSRNDHQDDVLYDF